MSNYIFHGKYKDIYGFGYYPYGAKQIRKKVKKYFMQPDEFLGIYELYKNAKTKEDIIFIVNLIETSKPVQHYKYCNIYAYRNVFRMIDMHEKHKLEIIHFINEIKKSAHPNGIKLLHVLMQWLYNYTVHTSSLNSVTFK